MEWLESLRIDRKNIAKVIAETCKKGISEIENLMKDGAVLDPQRAQTMGFVTSVSTNIVSTEDKIITIV